MLGGLVGLGYLLFDPIVKHIILQKLVLRNNSEFAQIWEEPPITPHLKVRNSWAKHVKRKPMTCVTLIPPQIYFFNLTNAEQVFAGGAKPRLKEIGPYVYQ